MSSSPPSDVQVDRPEPGIAVVTLNRPERRNAITPEMRERLRDTVIDLIADPTVRALVLTGAGGQFCAGGDVSRLASLPKDKVADLLRSAHPLIRALVESPKPVIAAVAGAAAGGGAGLALACDTVLMAEDARLVLPFNQLGLVPDYGLAYTLTRRLGVARATRLMLDPRPIDAPTALRCGLADEGCPPTELLQTAIALAARYSRQSALALAGIKRMVLSQSPDLQATLDIEVQAQTACFASPAFASGAAAFLARKSG